MVWDPNRSRWVPKKKGDNILIDSFEDGDLAEYTQTNTGTPTVQISTQATDGDRIMNLTDCNGFRLVSMPGDGLENYPEFGTIASTDILITDLPGGVTGFGYGASPNGSDGVFAFINSSLAQTDYRFGMIEAVSDTSSNTLVDEPLPFDPRGKVLNFEFELFEDGFTRARLYNKAGGLVKEVQATATGSNFQADGGLIFFQNNSGGGSASGQDVDYDFAREIIP
jgi:hypothetical protein